MTEPRTAAGRALLDDLELEWINEPSNRGMADREWLHAVLRIEAEAAEMAGGLDAAWAEAEAALPEFWHIRSAILLTPYQTPQWEVVAAQAPSRKGRIVAGRGTTLADALRRVAVLCSQSHVIPAGQDETPRTGEASS